MKQRVILACLIAFVFSLVLTGCCNRVEFTRTKVKLEQAERERDYLQSQLDAAQKAQKTQAGTPGQLQKQVNEFMKIRDALQQREDELAKLRETALTEAQTAQTLMQNLAAELQAETQKVSDLQADLKQAQQAITELQSKLQ
jgi:chromosome segregation ATPase